MREIDCHHYHHRSCLRETNSSVDLQQTNKPEKYKFPCYSTLDFIWILSISGLLAYIRTRIMDRHLAQKSRFLSGFVADLKFKFANFIRTFRWPLRGFWETHTIPYFTYSFGVNLNLARYRNLGPRKVNQEGTLKFRDFYPNPFGQILSVLRRIHFLYKCRTRPS